MRSVGTMERARGFGCSDHACLAYSSRAERDTAAVDWLLDGAARGQRLLAVTADADGGALLKETFAAAPGAADLREGVAVYTMADLYDLSRPIDPVAQLALYDGVVAQAINDGFHGIRVFADITALIADSSRRASHAIWEHYADAWMAKGNPLAPLCAYDATAITEPPEAVLAVHPLRRRPAGARASFGLYWDSGRRVLDGNVDAFGLPALEELLTSLPDEPVDIDVRDLDFLNGSGAVVLAAPRLRLVGAQPIVRRVWDVLGLDERQCP